MTITGGSAQLHILCCAAIVAVSFGSSIPVFKTSGNFYEVGRNVGEHFRDQIQKFYGADKDLNDKLIPFFNTPKGKKVYEDFLDAANGTFPQYVEELAGTADGAQLNFTLVFLMTIRVELLHVLGHTDTLKGCTDVFVNTAETYALGHNEDTDPGVKDLAYFVEANITQDDRNEHFVAYTYPGLLPGKAFGFNHRLKLAFSVNALYPTSIALDRPPRDFLNRAIAGSSYLYFLLRDIYLSTAYGFSTNVAIASTTDSAMSNYELLPNSDDDLFRVDQMVVNRSGRVFRSGNALINHGSSLRNSEVSGHYYHFNMYDHTSNASEVPGEVVSSRHRRARAAGMQPPQTLDDIKNILGDTQDQAYPIYRTPRPTDPAATSATAIFDLKACTMTVMTENPKTASDQQVFNFKCNN